MMSIFERLWKADVPRRKYGVVLAMSVPVVISLAACSGSALGRAAAHPTMTTVITQSPAPASGTATGTITAEPASSAAPVGACTTAQVSVRVDKPAPPTASGADQIAEGDVAVQNTSGGACVIRGLPGVSFVAGADGRQVGAAAVRAGGPGTAVTLAPGRRAHAELSLRQTGDTCRDTAPVRGYRIYLPGQRAAAFVPQPGRACRRAGQGQLTVRAFRSGPGGSGPRA